MRRWCVLALVLWTLTDANAPYVRLHAEEPLSPPNVLRYRRVRVPQERIADYTRGFLPMERSAFQLMLSQMQAQVQPRSAELAWIRAAEYQAVFSQGQLISGQATLQVTHVADTPTVLSLAPCGLAIGAATWQHAETTKPAAVGTDAAGDLLASVGESGDLRFPWTLRGVTNQWGECRFEVSLPAAPMSRLVIDLPSDLVLATDGGLLTPPASSGSGVAATPTTPTQPIDLQRWIIQLGGRSCCTLTVAPRQTDPRRQQLVSVQQDTIYRLVDDGLEVEFNVELAIHRVPLNELFLAVDSELQVIAVRVDNLDVNWASTSSEDGRLQTVRVPLAERLGGLHPTLQLRAVGPLHTGGSWRLPILQLQDVFWRQGTMSLIVPDTLEVRHLAVHNARQAAAAVPQDGPAGDVMRFEMFGFDGALEVNVARQKREIVADVGTTIDLDPGSITSLTLADVRCRFGERFVIEAQVPNAWTIDVIDAKWTMDGVDAKPDYQFVAYEAGHKRLQIQLTQPLTPKRSIWLAIRAHRTPSSWLAAEDFRPVEFLDVAQASRLVAVAPDASYRLDLVGDDGLDRVDPETLAPADAGRLQPRGGGLVFVDNDQADRLTINISREDPEYAAAVQVDAVVDQEILRESYRIECTPDTMPVGLVRVHLSETRTSPLNWQYVGEENAILSAQLLTDEKQAPASTQRTGETWEIVLRTPQSAPFEIRGQRQARFASAFAVALATLPAAASHEGRLTIRSLDGTGLSLKANSVRPIPCETAAPDSSPTAVASYRYDTSHNAQVVVDRVHPRIGPSPLWAWNCLVTSQYSETGRATHVATFLLESAGGTELQLRLPSGSELRSLDMNGLDATRSLLTGADGTHTVKLPAGNRFPRVEVTYETAGQPLRVWSRVAIEFPHLSVPVLDRRWTVWLPPGCRLDANNRGVLWAYDEPDGWRQRLFGPLSPRADERPFRAFSDNDWSQSLGHLAPQSAAATRAQAFLQRLGESLITTGSNQGSDALTWREGLARYSQGASEEREAAEVWVDAAWLADEGFRLETAIPPSRGSTPVEAAIAALASAHLTAVERGNQFLLTSRSGLARNPSAFVATGNPSVVSVRDDSRWAIEFDSLANWPQPGVIPLAAWVAPLSVPSPPWPVRCDGLWAGVDGRPWRVVELRVDDSGQCEVRVVHSASLWVVEWSVLLAVVGLVSGFGQRLRRLGYPLLLSTAVLAMLVPEGLVPITSSLFLGALLGVAMALLVRLVPSRHKDIASPRFLATQPLTTATAIVLIVTAFLVWGVHVLQAEQPPMDVRADGVDPTYQLVVPVDANLAPVGQYDYLPLEFYDALQRGTREFTGSRRDWLVTQATYRAVFNWRQPRSSLELTEFTAVYQLDVLLPVARLVFPWHGQSGSVELLEARLDGQPVELDWNLQRTGVSFPPSTVGPHQLELVLRPTTREELGERSLRFAVLPVARAQLQIDVPLGAPEVQIPSSLGSLDVDTETGMPQADLGPVRQLELRWRPGTADDVTPRPTDVQQLMWLKVRPKDQPEGVVLDAVFRMQAAGRQIEEVKLRVDSRLRLIAEQSPDFEWVEESAPESDDGLVTIRWREPSKTAPTLHLQFHVTNTTGLGNVSLPRLEFVDGHVTQRWLAVSVSPDLEFTSSPSDRFEPLDPPEFLTAWGEAESILSLCYRVVADDPHWSLATRARQSRSESRQSVDVSADRTKLELVLDADIETTNGEVFQHRLSVPRDFQVGTIAVIVGDTDVAKAAHHDGSGTVTVFLRRGITGAHRLSMRGFQPVVPGTEQLPLPSVSLVDATVLSHAVHIYRKAHVLIDVQTPADLITLPQVPVGALRESFGRLVTAFELNAAGITSSGGVTLNLRANQPRLDVRLVTTLHRVGDQWEAIADFDASIARESGGLVDRFRFEIPVEWTGPFSCEPDVPYEILAIPGQRRHLVIRPQQPVADRFQLRMRGRLELGANERGRTPNIMPLDATSVERFVVLPTQLDQQRIDWETPGLIEVPWQDAVPNGTLDAASQVAYRVWAKPRAVIADVQRVAGERQISLADVCLDCRTQERCFGVVSFTLEPAGAANCTLEVPENFEVVQAHIDGVPATMVPLTDRRWHVRLASEQLPQQLTIVFRGRLTRPVDNQSQQVAVPWIVDLNTVRTLWSIRGPVGGTLVGTDVESQRIGAVQQETLRLQNMADVVASAAETVLNSSAGDVQAWYTPWAIRLACAAARITQDRWLTEGGTSGHEIEVVDVDAMVRDQDTLAQRLKVSPNVTDYLRQTHRHPESRDIWDFSGRGATLAVHYAFVGEMPSLGLNWQPDPGRSRWPNLMATAALVALAVGLRTLVVQGVLVHGWQQWPYAVGALAGIVWWLLASPSLLGWVIVAVSLWGAIRWPLTALPRPPVKSESPAES